MYAIGVDIGGTNIVVGVVDLEGNIVSKISVSANKTDGQANMDSIVKAVSNVVQNNHLSPDNVYGVGIGIPGLLSNKTGMSIYCPNIAFNGIHVKDEILKIIKVPVYLDNDANCAALAESIVGAARGKDYSVTITLGTGIGTGIIINGNIYCGFNGAAVEFGHTVIRSGGKECSCGRKGCWETYASATALIEQGKKAVQDNRDKSITDINLTQNIDNITPKIIFDSAKEGNVLACRIIEQYIEYLAEGLTNIFSVFQPEVVVIGGGISNQGQYLLDMLVPQTKKRIFGNKYVETGEIRLAEVGEYAGLIGAAMLAVK